MPSYNWPPLPSGGGGGSVTDVTASSPLMSSGGNTPDISLAQAGSSNDGYLSSVDWNTFNGKQDALSLGNLTDAGTDGIVITGGTGAVVGAGTSIAQHVADASHNGYLLSTDWSMFNNKQSSLSFGNLTDAGTDGITVTGGTGSVIGSGTSISQHVADATHNGYLSSADWSTFNGKQASGNYITALTGDVTASGPGSSAATLATVNANVGSFGSTTAIPSFTVNAKGLITAASTNVVVAPAGTLTGTTLASNVVTSSLTTVGTIGTGVWNGTAIDVAHGGTGLATLTANNVILGNGTSNPTFVAPGSSGNVLTSNGTTWTSAAPVTSGILVAYISEQQTSGTAGGDASTGVWITRTLNTLVDPNSIVTSLSSNQFTLPAGSYQISCQAPAFRVGLHKAKLANITDSADTLIGSSEQTDHGINCTTHSFVSGIFTIAGSKVFEIQHQVQITEATDGFGQACSFTSTNEVYTQVTITKIA